LFAFRLAKRLETDVVSTSKFTIQRATDGLFEEVVREVAAGFRDVPHRAELFDALLARLIMSPECYRVIVCPNEYGDFVSDAACGIVGSLGLGASASYSFDAESRRDLALFDPAGGTAPDIAGKGICNPAGALWAFAMLLEHAGFRGLGHALDEAVRETITRGETTSDLGGNLDTMGFAEAACSTLRSRLTAGSGRS
ncbi:MAG: isocitrate/isopropylmalate family dehydrogenase, partial [Planctomycetota bacterium]